MSASRPPEVLFYHLQHRPLESVLPQLLEKTLQRGWRAVVQAGSTERLAALDQHLWTWRPDSFLPHGSAREGRPERHPIYLTTGAENPNGATVRFLVDGAEPSAAHELSLYQRIVLIFDGRDQTAVASARQHWTTLKGEGCDVTYWQQAAGGRWERKA